MNTLNPRQVGAALAATMSILYAACALLITVVPKNIAITFYNSLMHTIDVTTILGNAPTIGEFIIGLICIAIISWLVGATFAILYNITGKWFEGR